jgi:hypothetical protein
MTEDETRRCLEIVRILECVMHIKRLNKQSTSPQL